ncbi:MAG: universal stress protein [Cyclobacteriaceae bacterium]
MNTFENILVGLDNTAMDIELIRSVKHISSKASTKKILFTHVIRTANISDSLLKEFPNLIEDAIRDRKESLWASIAKEFGESDKSKLELRVVQGQPTKEVMKLVSKEEVDLVVVGRKKSRPNGGVIINRLARRAACSLLVIPEGKSDFQLNKILVPIDFSVHAHMALDCASTLSKQCDRDAEIITQNVFSVPAGYHYTGKTYTEFAEIMKDNAKKDYEQFISDIDIDLSKVKNFYTQDKNDDIIETIYRTAKKLKVDTIMVGAKGRTATTALFIGSAAEKLIQYDTDIPLFVIRPKGKNAGILEYLKEL